MADTHEGQMIKTLSACLF